VELKVLGAGCANCEMLARRAGEALASLGIEGSVEKVTDYAAIAAHGVMQTPALVADDKVILSGRVPTVPELVSLLAGVAD